MTNSDATVLPGFIDSHAHLTFGAGPDHETVRAVLEEEATSGLLAARALHNAQLALRAGVTTIRDCGARGLVVLRVRDAIADGMVPGPRIVACGMPITKTGGHLHYCGLRADSETEVRKSVRWLIQEGADAIKIVASGGQMTAGSNPLLPQYPASVLRRRFKRRLLGATWRVVGVAPTPGEERAPDWVSELANGAAGLLGVPGAVDPREIVNDGVHAAPGYGALNVAAREATTLTAETEGVLLDPVYTAKGMAALIDWIRQGASPPTKLSSSSTRVAFPRCLPTTTSSCSEVRRVRGWRGKGGRRRTRRGSTSCANRHPGAQPGGRRATRGARSSTGDARGSHEGPAPEVEPARLALSQSRTHRQLLAVRDNGSSSDDDLYALTAYFLAENALSVPRTAWTPAAWQPSNAQSNGHNRAPYVSLAFTR